MQQISWKCFRLVTLLCIILFLCSCHRVGSAKVAVETKEILYNYSGLNEIDTLINNAITNNAFSGAVVSVVHGDTVIYEKAYGYKQVKPKKKRMNVETMFDIASISKCVSTLTAIMQLVENDKIQLDDPVKKYLPDFAPWFSTSGKIDITIRQLLMHTSGLSAGLSMSTVISLEKSWGGSNTIKFVDYISKEAKRNFRPGSSVLYSCLNYIVLQGIVEKVTGQRLCDYAQKNIFDVLDMKHTMYFTSENDVSGYDIASTEVQANGEALNGRVHDPLARILNGGNSGNAGVFTNVQDLARFSLVIMNNGQDKSSGRRILKETTVHEITMPTALNQTKSRVLGWEYNSSYVGKLNTHNCICHTGYTGTSIVIDMDTKTAIILLTNRVHPKDKRENMKLLAQVRKKLSNIVADKLKLLKNTDFTH